MGKVFLWWEEVAPNPLVCPGSQEGASPCCYQSLWRRHFLRAYLHMCMWVVRKSLFLVFRKWMSVDAHNKLISSLEKQALLQCSLSCSLCHRFLYLLPMCCWIPAFLPCLVVLQKEKEGFLLTLRRPNLFQLSLTNEVTSFGTRALLGACEMWRRVLIAGV